MFGSQLKKIQIEELCHLDEKQTFLFEREKKLLKEYHLEDDVDEKATKKAELLRVIQNHRHSSHLKFGLLDQALNRFYRENELNQHWHDYLKLYQFDSYTMRPRADLVPFEQAMALFCLVASEYRLEYTEEVKKNWQRLAILYGSWHAVLYKVREMEQFSKKTFEEACPFILELVNDCCIAAFHHWTPGFILLARVYHLLGDWCHNSMSDLPTLRNLRDEFYRVAYIAYCFAEQLIPLPCSQVAFQNAANGGFEALQRVFGYSDIGTAKDAILDSASFLRRLKADLETKVNSEATLFGRYKDALGQDENKLQEVLRLIPRPKF